MKKISVIIPNYNYARYVSEAIESVLNQSYKNIELIVVNNGSTDNSLDVLKAYEDRLLLVNQSNLGQSGARNSGLCHTTGDYIAFLDADDSWESSKLEKQIALASDSTELIYCGIAPFRDPSGEIMPIVLPEYRGNCMNFFIENPGVSIVLSGESTALFSRNLLEKVGLFDGELNSTAGWDFFRRCSRFTKFDFIDEPLVNYRLHSSNMSNSNRNVIQDMRRSYSKFFLESDWEVSKDVQIAILRRLEWSYLKTYLKARDIRMALFSFLKLLQIISKFG